MIFEFPNCRSSDQRLEVAVAFFRWNRVQTLLFSTCRRSLCTQIFLDPWRCDLGWILLSKNNHFSNILNLNCVQQRQLHRFDYFRLHRFQGWGLRWFQCWSSLIQKWSALTSAAAVLAQRWTIPEYFWTALIQFWSALKNKFFSAAKWAMFERSFPLKQFCTALIFRGCRIKIVHISIFYEIFQRTVISRHRILFFSHNVERQEMSLFTNSVFKWSGFLILLMWETDKVQVLRSIFQFRGKHFQDCWRNLSFRCNSAKTWESFFFLKYL